MLLRGRTTIFQYMHQMTNQCLMAIFFNGLPILVKYHESIEYITVFTGHDLRVMHVQITPVELGNHSRK